MVRSIVLTCTRCSTRYSVPGTQYAALAIALALLAAVPIARSQSQPPSAEADRPVTSVSASDTPVATHERDVARQTLTVSITIFVLAIFVGVELINKVPSTLHTPLMSGSNAISGITVVGAIIAAGASLGVAPFLGFLAIVLAMINVAGGFLVTHRMLKMFKRG